MDPLSAVSLAGNILQFVDTTKRLLSTARQISRAGAAEDILELESLTRDLRSWAQRVTPSEPQNAKQGVWSEQEESIRALGRQSREVADELLGALDKLKAKSQGQVFRPLESLYRALRAIWTQKDIDVLQTRLDKIGNGIQRQLATYDSAKILGRIESLDEHRRSDFALLASQIDGLVKDLSQKSGLDGSLDETARLLQKAAAQGSRYAVEQLIVKQLRFDAMDDRRETIALAHNSTYAWIFGTGDQAGPTSFNDWLTSDKTLYWVSGRPGSGKSTFMVCPPRHRFKGQPSSVLHDKLCRLCTLETDALRRNTSPTIIRQRSTSKPGQKILSPFVLVISSGLLVKCCKRLRKGFCALSYSRSSTADLS